MSTTEKPKLGEKKAVDQSGATPRSKHAIVNARSDTQRSILEQRIEAKPRHEQSPDETVLSPTSHNAWILFSGDKPGGALSGKKALGETQCAQLYLCVGKMGSRPESNKIVGNNLKADSAGIMISQKTDVDENYNLADGTVGNVTDKSAVGIKADSIRVIGREGIKLVTSTDSRNSQSGKSESIAGIELIAGNDDSDLQPLVKGDNLASALEGITEKMSDFIETVNGFVRSQIDFNKAQADFNQEIASHVHPVAGPAATLPVPALLVQSAKTAISHTKAQFNQVARTANILAMQAAEIEGFKANRLTPINSDFINSKNNFTN